MYKFLIPLFALALLVGCTPTSPTTPEPTMPKPSPSSAYDGELLSGKHTAVLHTSEGDITVELDADIAPKTVTNFIVLAKTGYYDDLTFHRIIPDFMIQGGDPTGDGTGGDSIFGKDFEDEINANAYGLDKQLLKDQVQNTKLPPHLENASIKEYYELQGYRFNDTLASMPMERGALAMANRGPNTNGSQFFIIQREGGTDWLNGKHTVFGKVTGGMDVVDSITRMERDDNDKPLTAVTFTVEVKE